mmetsp:Transcript_22215/g.50429  ORF Transcript_22215/g.50429 Transcript_22215/m.50429 type:complete len:325 (-) Transcript_22215:203-1177(-)
MTDFFLPDLPETSMTSSYSISSSLMSSALAAGLASSISSSSSSSSSSMTFFLFFWRRFPAFSSALASVSLRALRLTSICSNSSSSSTSPTKSSTFPPPLALAEDGADAAFFSDEPLFSFWPPFLLFSTAGFFLSFFFLVVAEPKNASAVVGLPFLDLASGNLGPEPPPLEEPKAPPPPAGFFLPNLEKVAAVTSRNVYLILPSSPQRAAAGAMVVSASMSRRPATWSGSPIISRCVASDRSWAATSCSMNEPPPPALRGSPGAMTIGLPSPSTSSSSIGSPSLLPSPAESSTAIENGTPSAPPATSSILVLPSAFFRGSMRTTV